MLSKVISSTIFKVFGITRPGIEPPVSQTIGEHSTHKANQWNTNHLILINSSIWLIDGTLTGTTTPSQSEPGCNYIESVLHVPRTPVMQPHHQIRFSIISRTLWGRVSPTLQKYSRHILQPQLTEVKKILLREYNRKRRITKREINYVISLLSLSLFWFDEESEE